MSVNLGILDKLTKAVVVLLVVAGLVGVGVWYLPVIQQNKKMREDMLLLEREIAKEEALNRKLRGSIESVSKDPRTVERLARERLGYARPGETVIRFDAPAPAPPTATLP